MNIRLLAASVFGLSLALAACEPEVRWNCVCAAQCGEMTDSASSQICGTQDEAETKAAEANAVCVERLSQGCAVGGACACVCENTNQLCE